MQTRKLMVMVMLFFTTSCNKLHCNAIDPMYIYCLSLTILISISSLGPCLVTWIFSFGSATVTKVGNNQ